MVRKSIARSQTRRRWYLAGAAALLVALIATVVVLHVRARNHLAAQTGSQTAYNHAKKEAVVNNNGTPVNDSGSVDSKDGASGSSTYTPPTTDSGITITPSRSGSQVVITTKLVGYSDGTCNVTITNGDKSTTQTAKVIYAPDFSTCAGFSVPVSSLGDGTWKITLSVSSGGNDTSKTVTYEVSS